jgi:hypothetical protein
MRARRLALFFAFLPAGAVAQSIYVAPIVPPGFRLLADPAVAKELGLTAEQRAAADHIRKNWNVPAQGFYFGRFGYVSSDVMRAGVSQQIIGYLTTVLTKEQRQRLDQIGFQLREKEFGPHPALTMAAREISLRPDQIEDVRNLKNLRVEEIARVVTSGHRFEKVKAEVTAANDETLEKMTEMLTRTQRERLAALRGRTFVGTTESSLPKTGAPLPGVAVPAPLVVKSPVPELGPDPRIVLSEVTPPLGYRVILDQYPADLFGVYDLELRYLDTVSVQMELKVNLDQVRKLELALRDWSTAHLRLSGLDLNRAGKLHDLTAKSINEILRPEQRQRLYEIMMQRRALVGPEAMCGYPAAVEKLKLSPAQLQQLRKGKPVADVLTEQQLAARRPLLGKPFQLPVGVVDPLIDRMPSSPIVERPLVVPDVPLATARGLILLARQLNLTNDQLKKLRELAEDEPKVRKLIQRELSLDDTPPVAGAGRGVTPVAAVMDLYREAVERQCWDVLDPQQRSAAKKIFGGGSK